MPQDYIHVAYAISRRHGSTSYRARAYVALHFGADTDKPIKNSLSIGIGDTREEAEGDAIRHIHDMYRREGLTAPEEIRNAGKLSGVVADNYLF